MEDKWDEPRQVCRDKGFNIVTKKFSQRQGVKKTLSRHGKSLSRQKVQSQKYKATQLCHDNKSMLLGETMSRQKTTMS